MNILEQAKKLLKENNQDKLLNMMDKMSEDKREKLAQQIIDLDFVKLNNLYEETKEKPEILEKKLEHIKSFMKTIQQIMILLLEKLQILL